jgi:hypothetical protein
MNTENSTVEYFYCIGCGCHRLFRSDEVTPITSYFFIDNHPAQVTYHVCGNCIIHTNEGDY